MKFGRPQPVSMWMTTMLTFEVCAQKHQLWTWHFVYIFPGKSCNIKEVIIRRSKIKCCCASQPFLRLEEGARTLGECARLVRVVFLLFFSALFITAILIMPPTEEFNFGILLRTQVGRRLIQKFRHTTNVRGSSIAPHQAASTTLSLSAHAMPFCTC